MHAGAVLEFVVPDALEAGGEEEADGGEHVEVEEGVAVWIVGGEFVGEGSVGYDLGAEGGGFVLVAEGGEGAVVLYFGEVGDGGGLEEPGGSEVALGISGEAGET